MQPSSQDPPAVLGRPYAERQCIVVADDAVVEAEREVEARSRSSSGKLDWQELAKQVAVAVGASTGVVPAGVTAVGVEIVSAALKARAAGLDVLTITRSEAASLSLLPGHPRDRVLYIGHPGVPATYFPAASFHRLTFEHKFAEAIRLLMALGARELEVEHVRGWSDEFAADLAVSVPAADVNAGGHAGRKRSASSSALFKAALRGSDEPTIPENLVWFEHEPTWQQVAEGRLKYGLHDFQLSVRYDDDYGVHAGLKLGASKVGLDLGGKFQEHEETTWKITGSFGRQPAPSA